MVRITNIFGDNAGSGKITTIKGGGVICPKLPTQGRGYNVLKYYSMNRCFGSPSLDSNAPDYNNPQTPTLNRGLMAGQWNWQIREKGAPPATFAITDIATDNFLTIHNQRDIYGDQQNYTPIETILGETNYDGSTYYWDYDNESIQHVEPNDEYRQKNESGKFEIVLYEKNASKSFKSIREETASSKEVDAMEWLFLHTKVVKCQKGYVYIEINDLEITGDTTDNMLYVICWETDKDNQLTTLSQIDNESGYYNNSETEDIRSQFYHIDNSNRVEQAVRISDLSSASTKKVVLNTNKFVDKGEEAYISVLIGLCPEDIARDIMYANTDEVHWQNSFPCPWLNCSYTSLTNVTMIFSSVTIKIKDFGDTVNTRPICAPVQGVIGLQGNDYYQVNGTKIVDEHLFIRMSTVILGNDGIEWTGSGSHSGVLGFANAYDSDSSNNAALVPAINVDSLTLSDYADSAFAHIVSGVPRDLNALFATRLRGLVPDNYQIRLPRFFAGIKGRSNYSSGVYSSAGSATADLVLYIGGNPENSTVLTGGKFKDFADGLTELQRWSFADINSTSQTIIAKDATFNNGSQNKNGFESVPVPNSDMDFISDFIYANIDLTSYTSGQLYDMGLFLFVELNGRGVKNFSTSTADTTTNQVSSSGDHYDFAYIRPVPLYNDLSSGAYQSYGCMIFKTPQIIEKGESAEGERYYSS